MTEHYLYYKAINWNIVEDELDNATWERATSLFWLDTRIPIADDRKKWDQLSQEEKDQLNNVLINLTNLATYQSIEAGEVIRNSERSQQEVAIFNNLQFTEMVNTKAYNTALRSFNQNDNKVNDLFIWVDNNNQVKGRLQVIDEVYSGMDPLKKRFMVLCVEGVMVYSQLSYLLNLWINKKFNNLDEIVKMVIMNESLHCLYLSHKIKILMSENKQKTVEEFKKWAQNIVKKIVNQELSFISDIYSEEMDTILAINLVKQEANNVLNSIGLSNLFIVDESGLFDVNHFLNRLRYHELTPHNKRSERITDILMYDDDYDF